MANDPLWIDASTGAPAYSAAELRQAMALPLMYGGRNMGARAGVRPGGNQLNVSIVGSTITVQPGLMCVDPGLSTPQGPYWVAITPAETHTLTAAHVSNPRKDIIVGRVYDNTEDSSGNRFARTEYIAGTPAGVPVEPSVPTGAFRIATIDQPASPGAPVVTHNFPFAVASGGVVPVRDFNDRTTVGHTYDGQLVWRQDRVNWIDFSDGAAWHTLSVPVVTSVADLASFANPYSGQIASNTGDGALYRYTGSAWRPAAECLIAESILVAPAANVPFSSIPSTYRSLRLEVVCRSSVASVSTNLHVQFNGDTAGNYDYQEDAAQQSATAALEQLAQNGIPIREMAGASAAAANHPGIFTIEIPWYAGTTFVKLIHGQSTFSQGTSTGHLISRRFSGRWRSTNAVTSIVLVPASGNFIAGSSFSLYGVP